MLCFKLHTDNIIITQINMHLNLVLCNYCLLGTVFNFVIGINIWKKYSGLRKKINIALNKQPESALLLDINEYEYPRANETIRKIHRELWKEYYDCLRNAYNEIGSKKTVHPIALEVLEGTSVKLRCQMCISPMEVYINNNIEWYFNSTANNETNRLVEESDYTFISPEDKTLTMYNVKTDQAGQYWCKLGDTLSVSYHISIDTDIEGVKVVHPALAPNMPHAISQKIIPEYNVIIDTAWTKWSPCSKCNAVGKKVRYGYCTISSSKNIIKKNTTIEKRHLQDYKRQKDEQNIVIKTTTTTLVLNENAKDKIKMILQVFRNKLPCKSKYLPRAILDIPVIRKRKTEMMVQYCKVKCPENIIFEVRGKNGNVIESANNSAGIYSMVQGMPVPSPPIKHTTIYQKYNQKIVVICPGAINTDIPINWKINDQVFNPSNIKEHSQGRIHINAQMHIIFESLKFEDTNIYSCWQKNDIIGVVKLNVTGEIELQADYSVIMLGGILIISIFMIIFWRAFQGRKRFTIH